MEIVTKIEMKKKYKKVFDFLKFGGKVIAKYEHLPFEKNVAIASIMEAFDGKYIHYSHYGNSAISFIKRDFNFLLDEIFDDTNSFYFIEKQDYFDICNAYFENERIKRQQQLDTL